MTPRTFAIAIAMFTAALSASAQDAPPAEAPPAEAAPAPEGPPPPPPIALEGDEARRNVLNPMQGQPPPALAITQWINAEGLTLEALKGQVVLLDFWGVWCGPCRAAIPHLVQLHTVYKDRGLVVIGVHTPNAADQAAPYIEANGISYPVAIDGDGATARAYQVDSYPDLYFIDHTGALRYADAANADIANIDTAVHQLLEERRIALGEETPVPTLAEALAPPPAEPAPAEAAPAE